MGKWYIDRSRNINSIISSIHYDLLKELIDTPKQFIEPSELIDMLQIDGANKNALLTNFRDLGLIDKDNKPSEFFKACTKSKLPVSVIVLLILLKRNDEKKDSNTVKPFVVIAKALSKMLEHNYSPELTWGICDNYLMNITSYESITWERLYQVIKSNTQVLSTPVLDIWFNALIATGLFEGDKKQVTLKKKYYDFIKFISKYGAEMKPSQTREEYLQQACSAQYGWYELFAAHTDEAISVSKNLRAMISFIQTVDSLTGNSHIANAVQFDYSKFSKNELEKELDYLLKLHNEVRDRIISVQERLLMAGDNKEQVSNKTNAENENLFVFYLQNNKDLADNTIHNYFRSLRKMKDLLVEHENIVINTEIYFIADLSVLDMLIQKFEQNDELKAVNEHDHYSISAAYNNYREFLRTMGEIC